MTSDQWVWFESPATLLELLPDVVLVLDSHGRVQWGNQAAERFFGRRLEESIGISALDFLHEDDLDFVLRSLESIRDKEIGTLIELRVITPMGWRLVEVIGRPLPHPGTESVLFCIRDITERRRYEVAHNETDKFRSLVQNAAWVTILVSTTGMIESASAALTRLFGYDPEDVTGRPFQALFVPDDGPNLDSAFAAAAQGRQSTNPVNVDATCLHYVGGRPIPVELSIVSLLEDPTVRGFVVSLRDNSIRKQAETTFRGLLDAAPDAMVIIGEDGRIVLVNQQAEQLFGYERGDLLGEQLELVIPDTRRSVHVQLRKRFFSHPEVRSMGSGRELFCRRRDGTSIPVEVSLSPFPTTEGILVSAAVRDITQRKAIEAELEEARRMAVKQRERQAASEERRRIARDLHDGLAHELAFIASKARRLNVDHDLSESDMRHLASAADRALDEARRAITVLSDARAEPLHQAIVQTAEDLTARLDIALDLDVSDVGVTTPLVTETLLRIVREAIINAAQHGTAHTVAVRLHDHDDMMHLVLDDDGRGFDPEQRVEHGGFGLMNMRERAESIGGTFHLRSQPGQGTRIEVVAPAPAPSQDPT